MQDKVLQVSYFAMILNHIIQNYTRVSVNLAQEQLNLVKFFSMGFFMNAIIFLLKYVSLMIISL